MDLAVVMPAVHRSFYTDMAGGGKYGTFAGEELLAIARSLFPLSTKRAGTFIAGLSMGGYGAYKLALTCPDKFAAAASLSGAMDMVRLGMDDSRNKEFRWIFGEPRRLAGTRHDLFHLARKARRSGADIPQLYQCCGISDFLYADNVRFRDFARKLDLPLTYEDGPGIHEWDYWDRQIQHVIRWLPLKNARK